MENKECCVCLEQLTPKTVYGGMMGLLYRLFFRSKGWKDFGTCQKCRNLSAMGWSAADIKMAAIYRRNKE